jgi:hypothetical protein
MKNIDFGKIDVSIDDYAIQGNAVLGIRESGKSYTSTYAGERLMDAGIPIVGIDPIGIWHSLRIPGGREGYEGYPVVVVGGQHADLPLTPESAEATMRAAMAAGVSIVFDMYDVKLSKRQWRDIVVAVVKVLLYENKEHGLRHVFIEEAPEFVPQKIGPDQGVVYSFVERLVRMGGNSSLGVTLIGQRAEEMNKAVLELCDCLILHRQKGRRSLENLSKWLELASPDTAKAVAAAVPLLKNGEAFVWPRGEEAPVRTHIPEKHTFHPDRRARHKAVAAEGKRMDAGAFVEKMKAELARTTKTSPIMPELVGKALADQLAGKNSRIILGSEITAKVEAARAEGYEAGRKEAVAGLFSLGEILRQTRIDADNVVRKLNEITAEYEQLRESPQWGTSVVKRPEYVAAQRQANRTAAKQVDAIGIPSGEFTVLKAVAMYPEGVDRDQLSVLTTYKRSTRDRYVAKLAAKGWLEAGSRITITPNGMNALGANYEPLPTGKALQDYWLGRLPEGERRLFERVLEAYPNEVHRGELSAHTGYKRSTRDRYLSQLVARRVVEATGDGTVKASPVLFQHQ